MLAVATSAHADTPATPVAEFFAPPCPGATTSNPRAASGDVPDLTRVWGPRLDDYNAGRVVVLYSNYGTNEIGNIIPPTCGTRYVTGVGPVSEWMYCTDLWNHTCSGTDGSGQLLDMDGDPIPGMDPLGGPNPKLVVGGNNDREKLIAYLVRNGHSYSSPGGFMSGVTSADPSGTSDQRAALQALVWCISDPPGAGWPDLQIACDATMSSARQAELLALIPDVPVIELDLVSPPAPLAVGDTATITLRTKLFGRPIDLAVTGVAGTLSVVSGPATLGTGSVIVTGSDPNTPENVVLGYTPTIAGQVDLQASAQPDAVSQIGWHRSPGIADDGAACQVYAVFHDDQLATLSDTATATFAASSVPVTPVTPVTTPQTPAQPVPAATSPRRLATSGVEVWPTIAAGSLAVTLGAACLSVALFRRRRRDQRAG